jgi:hypothetical protein
MLPKLHKSFSDSSKSAQPDAPEASAASTAIHVPNRGSMHTPLLLLLLLPDCS